MSRRDLSNEIDQAERENPSLARRREKLRSKDRKNSDD
jgi:hypothetical protein